MPVQLSMSLFPLFFLPGPSDVQSNGPKGKSGRGLLLLFFLFFLFFFRLPFVRLPRFSSSSSAGSPFFHAFGWGVPLREEEEEERASFISLSRSIDRSAGMEKKGR